MSDEIVLSDKLCFIYLVVKIEELETKFNR